mmetsp:Transcript_12214/g.31119  ORF Transcript_12214/g.31119 Transcript_12214/m.31119 type:complete len:271 (+) Transcript_12214:1548-2360(+)
MSTSVRPVHSTACLRPPQEHEPLGADDLRKWVLDKVLLALRRATTRAEPHERRQRGTLLHRGHPFQHVLRQRRPVEWRLAQKDKGIDPEPTLVICGLVLVLCAATVLLFAALVTASAVMIVVDLVVVIVIVTVIVTLIVTVILIVIMSRGGYVPRGRMRVLGHLEQVNLPKGCPNSLCFRIQPSQNRVEGIQLAGIGLQQVDLVDHKQIRVLHLLYEQVHDEAVQSRIGVAGQVWTLTQGFCSLVLREKVASVQDPDNGAERRVASLDGA